MDDELTPLEAFLDRGTSQIKWTVSISVFLITAIFTVLAFKGITFLMPTAYVISFLLGISIVFLLMSIVIGWSVANKIFILHGIILKERSKKITSTLDLPYEESEETKKELKEITDSINNLMKWHITFFIMGIFLFMSFFVFYIVLININIIKGAKIITLFVK